jgi:hypothetical protein
MWVSMRKLNPSPRNPGDAFDSRVEIVSDIGDIHQPGWPTFAGWLRNRRKTRFCDAVLGDDDFFAAFGGVDQGREIRLGLGKIDHGRSLPEPTSRGQLVKLVNPQDGIGDAVPGSLGRQGAAGPGRAAISAGG